MMKHQRKGFRMSQRKSASETNTIHLVYIFFTFCHKGGVICIFEVIDISLSNVDSSLCFILSSISHDVLCIWASLVAQIVKCLPTLRDTWV